jgi:hypothetical protein
MHHQDIPMFCPPPPSPPPILYTLFLLFADFLLNGQRQIDNLLTGGGLVWKPLFHVKNPRKLEEKPILKCSTD